MKSKYLFGLISAFISMQSMALSVTKEVYNTRVIDSDVRFFEAMASCENFIQSVDMEIKRNRRIIDASSDTCIIAIEQDDGYLKRCHTGKSELGDIAKESINALNSYNNKASKEGVATISINDMPLYSRMLSDKENCEVVNKSIWANH